MYDRLLITTMILGTNDRVINRRLLIDNSSRTYYNGAIFIGYIGWDRAVVRLERGPVSYMLPWEVGVTDGKDDSRQPQRNTRKCSYNRPRWNYRPINVHKSESRRSQTKIPWMRILKQLCNRNSQAMELSKLLWLITCLLRMRCRPINVACGLLWNAKQRKIRRTPEKETLHKEDFNSFDMNMRGPLNLKTLTIFRIETMTN